MAVHNPKNNKHNFDLLNSVYSEQRIWFFETILRFAILEIWQREVGIKEWYWNIKFSNAKTKVTWISTCQSSRVWLFYSLHWLWALSSPHLGVSFSYGGLLFVIKPLFLTQSALLTYRPTFSGPVLEMTLFKFSAQTLSSGLIQNSQTKWDASQC